MKPTPDSRPGNRYDEPMVVHDVSASLKTPGALLVGRLHVDLCRLASALGPGTAASARV